MEIQKCLDVLKRGGTILYPTDTIWGIGCDATNVEAVKRIFQIKKREESKSMIILVDREERISSYIRDIPEQAWPLIEYSESPLTLILPGAKNLAKNIIAEDGSAGIRITKDEFCRKLIEKFRKPIVSTSANLSGDPSPANFKEVREEIRQAVDYVVALRQEETRKAVASRIIKLGLGGEIKVIR